MKNIYLIFLVWCSIGQLYSQKAIFDVYTYTPPTGWKKEIKEGVVGYSFVNKKDKSWCQIGIFQSTSSKGSMDADFNSEWETLVAKQYHTTEPPLNAEIIEADGWKIKSGAGNFIFNNKDAMVLLTTFSGYNVCASIIVTMSNERYIKDVENIIGSLEIKKPEAAIIGATTVPIDSINIAGSWGKSNSVSQLYNRYGTYSYNKQQYYFNTNGTYTFLAKNYSEDNAETVLIKETGTYSVNGNQLTLIPNNSVIEAWTKKSGADNYNQLKSSQKRALEKGVYQIEKEGNNLLLSTVKETTRDGRFSIGNSYRYGPLETFTAIILPEK